MKILLIGRGVIATQYGWAFDKAGHHVEFYVRPGRKAQIGEEVRLRIYDGRKKIRGEFTEEIWKAEVTEALRPNYDLIVVSVQHYQLQQVIDTLAGKIGSATVLVFNNVWDEPEEVVAKLPMDQVVWGFPTAGGGFDQWGTLNGSLFRQVNIGTLGCAQKSRQQQVIALFQSARFRVNIIHDFRSYLFAHFILNTALHSENRKLGQGLATSLAAMQTSQFWRSIQLNLKELLPVLVSRGVDLKASSELNLLRIPPWLLAFIMTIALRQLPIVKQIFSSHSNPVELESYGNDVLTTATKLKIDLPRLNTARI
ncbi:2-dehydropantoate 2-reductase N-terminal domain-containing protein [Larkinella harenae]